MAGLVGLAALDATLQNHRCLGAGQIRVVVVGWVESRHTGTRPTSRRGREYPPL
jgi:hypothetical protein